MKIVFISTMSIYPWGGSEELWYKAALVAGAEKNIDVLISVFKHKNESSKIQNLREIGVRILYKSHNAKGKTMLRRMFGAFSLDRLIHYEKIKRWKPDCLVISQGGTFDILTDKYLMKLLEKFKRKYIIVCHGNVEGRVLGEMQMELVKKCFLHAKYTVFVAEWARSLCEKQILYKLHNSKIVYNPINLSDFTPVKTKENACEVVRMAMVGSLTIEWKGHDILLEVLSSEKWQKRKWRLSIYGEGKDYRYIKSLIDYYSLNDKVKLLGRTNDIRHVWENHDIHLMPSRVETAPLALVEAMICSVPSVVVNIGGISEWVTNGNSFISRAATAKEFDEALECAWTNKILWNKYGANARNAALNRLAKNKHNDLLTLIEVSLKSRPVP